MKEKLIIYISIFLLFCYSVFVSIQNYKLNKNINELVKTNSILANKTTQFYSISLNPSIVNKTNATFGNNRQIENNFYFTMKDIQIELNPDSIKTFKK